jgi:hypothetical protein
VDAQCSKRFAAYGWLKKHIFKDHKVDLPELSQEQDAANKRLMQQQRNFKAGVVGVIEGGAAEVPEELECGICGYKTSATENIVTLSLMLQIYFLNAECPGNATMTDHYLLCHLPRLLARALVWSSSVTGECLKENGYDWFEQNLHYYDDVAQSLFVLARSGFIADIHAFFLCVDVLADDKELHGEIDVVRTTTTTTATTTAPNLLQSLSDVSARIES